MSRLYTRVACDRCGDMYETLAAVLLEPQFICNRCLRALLQERLNEPETDAPATPEESECTPAGCESDPSEVELDNDLIADLKQQLDLANEALRSKEADLENERRAGDAMQESLANLRNENAELQESYKRLYSRKEFLECRFTEFKRQSLMYYKKYVEELGGRIDANKKLNRLEKSRWYVRLRRWARRQWEYDIYA